MRRRDLLAGSAIVMVSAWLAFGQVASDFPDLTVEEATAAIRAEIGCPRYQPKIERITSREADERIVTLRMASGEALRLVFLFEWRGAPPTGVVPGKWKYNRVDDAEEKDKPEKPPSTFGKRTRADMRAFAIACEAYAVDNNVYPTGDVKNLWRILAPTYIQRLPNHDEWGHPFRYDTNREAQNYLVASPGADGVYQVPESDLRAGGWRSGEVRVRDRKADFVFTDGQFVAWYPDEDEIGEATRRLLRDLLICPPDPAATSAPAATIPGTAR